MHDKRVIGSQSNGLTSASSVIAFIANQGVVKEGVYALTQQAMFSQLDLSLYTNLQIYKDPLTGAWSTNAKATPLTTTTTVYVDVATGNDTTGNGTIGNPYKTIAKGYSRSFAKLTVMVKAGTYVDTDGFNNIGVSGTCTDINVIAYGGTVTAQATGNVTACKLSTANHYFEGITWVGGINNVIDIASASLSTRKVQFKNCKFNNSISSNGLGIQYNGLFILEGCTSDSSYLDALNYHNLSASNKLQLVIENGCTVTNAGTQGGGTTNNATTIHDGGNIVRINGNYSGGQNRTVHDINNSKSLNIACKSDSSKEANQGNWAVGMSDADATIMWLVECETSGATNKGYQYYGSAGSPIAKIYTRNCTNTCGVASDNVTLF